MAGPVLKTEMIAVNKIGSSPLWSLDPILGKLIKQMSRRHNMSSGDQDYGEE